MSIVSRETVGETPYVRLTQVDYLDTKGRSQKRKYSVCERLRAGNGDGIDCCDILAVMKQQGKPEQLVLVAQYRPPLDAVCIEFPSGCIEKGEPPEAAALRELKEETGYVGKIIEMTPPCAYEPGLTSSMFHFVHIEIDGALPENSHPVQQLDEDEDIQVFFVPYGATALDEIKKVPLKFPHKKVVMDGKLQTFLLGLKARR